jgi:hypothetical protein
MEHMAAASSAMAQITALAQQQFFTTAAFRAVAEFPENACSNGFVKVE